jgi:hypothetical protein
MMWSRISLVGVQWCGLTRGTVSSGDVYFFLSAFSLFSFCFFPHFEGRCFVFYEIPDCIALLLAQIQFYTIPLLY